MKGHRLWSDEEDAILRLHYRDWGRLLALLPGRSKIAVENRAQKLGLAKTRHMWLASEIAKLRRLYPSAPREVLMAEFPWSRWTNIITIANCYGIHRQPQKYLRTGIPIIDTILTRIEEIGWNLSDLDAESGTGSYFRCHTWRRRKLNYRYIAKAVKALDGQLTIEWR